MDDEPEDDPAMEIAIEIEVILQADDVPAE